MVRIAMEVVAGEGARPPQRGTRNPLLVVPRPARTFGAPLPPSEEQRECVAIPSGAFHLILSMQYHLTRRARSREVRLLGGRVPFAFFASSREVAIARPASGPAT
ncbi:protein of unknown function [Methanoculleus bourgensis]|uniref:Uncharacterized protein n=1 Tax=Methanoculleus bourgensis TaxID=83986 RepID=A0A0X3BLJ1_9EURY|nr:protein of unknown function [Methanoculleus bourgensis]